MLPSIFGFALIIFSPSIKASEATFTEAPQTIEGNTYDFESIAPLPTLILIVRNEEDIKSSFRLATALENHRDLFNYLIVADLSEKSFFEVISIKRTAKRFFKSELSKKRISIENTKDLIQAFSSPKTVKTGLVSNAKKILWESPEHYSDLNELIEQAKLTD
ncbi:hypothetical protein MLD52_05550 [Puniceicoccaceae bacterium K14]|nr:hypothetical protein [Puniceicoccaceae bacterium K14]